VPAITRLVQGDEDAIRRVVHRFNEMGPACLDPRWADGRPRRISPDVKLSGHGVSHPARFVADDVLRAGGYEQRDDPAFRLV
jgi:hypothetical protein